MSGKPKKLTPEDVRLIRLWWRVRREIPTRNAMCEYFGINKNTLMSTATGLLHKAVR